MSDIVFPLLILLGVLTTTGILITGIVMMLRGNSDSNPERSNKLMQMRVLAQGATVLLALLFLMLAAGGD